MNKREVCEYLGKSKRTVETLISRGRLKIGYFPGPNGKTAIFERTDVEALKQDLEKPWYRATPETAEAKQGSVFFSHEPPAERKSAIAPDVLMALAEAIRSLAPRQLEAPREPAALEQWLTLPAAAKFSGLPKRYLVAQAEAGTIRAVNVGTGKLKYWRFAKP